MNCCLDFRTWCLGCFCPYISHGLIMEAEGQGNCVIHCLLGALACYTGFPWLVFWPRRNHIRQVRGLPEYPFPHCDFCVSCFCQSCAAVQEYHQISRQPLLQTLSILCEVEDEADIIEEEQRAPKMTQVLYRTDGSMDIIYKERIDRRKLAFLSRIGG